MAAHELVLLSSSPPCIPDSDIVATPPALHAPHAPSLSPDSPKLPSPSELVQRKPQGLKSGSRAAEIPNGVTLGFASAAALVRDRLLSLEEDNCASRPLPARVERTNNAVAKDQTAESKRPTKRPPKQANAAGGTEVATKKPSRRRAKGQAEAVSPEAGTPDVGVPAKKTAKRRTKANAGATAGSKDPDDDVPIVFTAAEKLKDRQEALGRDPEKPARQGKSVEGGAVEKLKKLKGRPSTIAGSTTAVDDVACLEGGPVVPQKPKKQKPKAPKASEKKPRAKRKKPSDQELAKPAGEMQPRQTLQNAKPAACMDSETTSKHFSRGNSIDLAAAEGQEPEPLELEPAMMRRLSWTPPRDTKSSPNGPDRLKPIDLPESPVHEDSALPVAKTSFTNLLQNFGYSERAPDAARMADPRAESGEAFTKRRKLEVTNSGFPVSTDGADCSKLVDKPNKSAESSAVGSREQSPEKPEKAPRKRPRTITDLATAAYRAAAPTLPAECPPVDPKVSAFFAPRNGSTSAADSPDVAGAERSKRTVRQKSPAKKAEGKARKTNAKSKKALKLAAEKLLSPETALRRMNRQDVLFGTSSQLAREDSPTFIRDIQQALRDSEFTGTQRDNVETLYLKPAAAASGLSLVGRRRGLWAAASRDLDDGILEEEKAVGLNGNVTLSVEDSVVFLSDVGAKAPSHVQARTGATFVDASSSPGEIPAAAAGKADGGMETEPDDLPQVPPIRTVEEDDFDTFPSAQPAPPSSDYIDIDDFNRQHQLAQQRSCVASPDSVSKSRRSPESSRRTALQPLTARPNVPLLIKSASGIPGIRTKTIIATTASGPAKRSLESRHSPTRRPRGRPPKDAVSEADTLPPKRPRGRPPKDASPGQDVSPSKRPRGRPPKSSTKEAAQDRATKADSEALRVRTTASPTMPKKRKLVHDEEWPDIDEIEDSEEEISPSPPRRKTVPDASALTLNLSQEIPGPAAVPLSPSRKRKVTSHIPPESLEAVYPHITATVKAAPPSQDPSRPSWHEKMLLYDPIVAEELAEWLNGEGIRVSAVVPIPKAKKGRKKKGAQEYDTQGEQENERVESQELPAWVVQRWCEENSICCIYKESLWNGRRARY